MVRNKKLDELKKTGENTANQKKIRRSFLSYFKKNKEKISFGDKLSCLYSWLSEGKLSTRDKAIVVGALIYFINPLDAIPDLTPFIGFSDDLGIIYLVYNFLQNRALEESGQSREKED